MRTLLFAAALTCAAIAAPAKAQSDELMTEYGEGTLSFWYAECDDPIECKFAYIGCEDGPWIQFSMDQREVAAWFAESNGRVLLKVGQVSMETIPTEIRHADMDDDWWPTVSTPDTEALWAMLQPGRTLEITAGPKKQLSLVIPKQIEYVRTSCKK